LEDSQGPWRAIAFYLVTNIPVRLNSRNPTAVHSQTLAATSGEFKETTPKGAGFPRNREREIDKVS